jgi:hypothetical protein
VRRSLHAGALALALVIAMAASSTAGAGGTTPKTGTKGPKHPPTPHPARAVQPRAPHAFDFKRDIGLVEGDRRDSLWLMIADTTLAIGDSLTLISDEPDPGPDSPPDIFAAAVAQRLDRKPQAKMIPTAGDVFYRLVAPKGALNCCIFGYGVRVPRSEIRIVQYRAEADLDKDGTPEHFQGCAGIDTLHPAVWSGEPFRGKRRWARDYSLGYEGAPDCPGYDGSE